jgi:hypothetical protein
MSLCATLRMERTGERWERKRVFQACIRLCGGIFLGCLVQDRRTVCCRPCSSSLAGSRSGYICRATVLDYLIWLCRTCGLHELRYWCRNDFVPAQNCGTNTREDSEASGDPTRMRQQATAYTQTACINISRWRYAFAWLLYLQVSTYVNSWLVETTWHTVTCTCIDEDGEMLTNMVAVRTRRRRRRRRRWPFDTRSRKVRIAECYCSQ